MINQDYKWLTDTYVAHRGLFDNANGIPENSIPAFEQASEQGFAIETDVQMTADGVLVLFHDDTLKRMTGADGKLSNYTYEQLLELRLLDTDCKIPTFEEFLAAANGVNLVVEIKTHDHIGEVEQKTYEALKSYKGHYCIESFNPLIVRWFKVHAPEVIRGTLSTSFKETNFSAFRKWLLRELKLCKWNGSQFIAYDAATIANCKPVKRFAKRVPIICWTIRSQEQYDNLSKYFDNMIFDSYAPSSPRNANSK
ncbi:MAG: glycerophosphodiester phosphodiesterase [Clostridiales bacterium]|nr:glycerophosphodiester phosphodiesterase [Clostridiales bacterium]